ncbi:hypothetical protein, variant 2 [Aphanomyces astaci]|uniref:BTB domain-containing protein n=1 Tax=Aphanomyces astaci TaxID=112090 RepID=W4FQW3_APHAT|nr:hypothetical protein, variant 2 [Aphanomyces astaci]ETV69885.1 hypothetical protein, variant 2 [Aphanomyces astaci]|eukprot:XP_009840622.1 hypothetical protein, variant 2 [Aphanomyces astaci]
MGLTGKEDDLLHVKDVLHDMIESTKQLDAFMQRLCRENLVDASSIPAAFDRNAMMTSTDLEQRRDNNSTLDISCPIAYFERMSKDLQGRPDGFKLPLHLLVEKPVNLNAICASDIRGSDKVSYRINDMAISPRASLNQLMETLVARLCAVNCTLSTVDADKLAHCLVFVSQDADKHMVLAGQALFPSMLTKCEWKTGSIIAHIGVNVGLQEDSTWGVGVTMELDAILRCRPIDNEVATNMSPPIRARYTCAFHRDTSQGKEERFCITHHYVELSEMMPTTPRMPLASVVRMHQPREKADTVDVLELVHSCDSIPTPLTFPSPFGRTRIIAIASSSVHTLFLSDLGHIYAKGASLDGALGLGTQRSATEIPQLVEFAEVQTMVIQVAAAGDDASGAHSIAVTSDGQVYTWGARVACGTSGPPQCDRPEQVIFPMNAVQGIQVAAGTSFSLVLSQEGHVFAWGKFLHGRLGLGNIPPNRMASSSRGIRHDQQLQKLPAKIPNLSGVTQIACGAAHSACVTRGGQLWMWGKNSHGQLGLGHLTDLFTPTLLGFFPPADNMTSSAATPAMQQVACGPEFTVALDQDGGVWSWGAGLSGSGLPAFTAPPSSLNDLPRWSWLRPARVLALGHGIQSISAGGSHAGAVTWQGDAFVWGTLSAGALFQDVPLLVCPTQVVQTMACHDTNTYVIGGTTFLGKAMFDLLSHRTLCDVVLLASGKRLAAHQMVLSHRSSVLRNLMAAETYSNTTMLQVILPPSIRHDICVLVLEYIYTDTLFTPVDPTSCVPMDLHRAAIELDLPGLAALCDQYITMDLASYTSSSSASSSEPSSILTPQLTFVNALGSNVYADVTLLAESHAIPAHKCMLVARSDYFRALFDTNMRDANLSVLPVDVSYATMQRVLAFMYSDVWTPPSSDEALLDELVAADKYGVARLKVLCEANAVVTLENCMEVLVLADMVHAMLLYEV